MSFHKLGLASEILRGVQKQGYTEPTPIQSQAIPEVLAGHDVLAGAQTGTGKTAAFTLPMLQILNTTPRQHKHAPRALVLAPTRELAAQVGESVRLYGEALRLRSTVIFGGVGIQPQINRLKQGVDIVVGTPGRLLDLVNQRALDLTHIEILVLDEADRMLDMGFIHDIRKIIRLVPDERQTLFFSATYSKEIKKLADTILYRPVKVEVARENTAAETVSQQVYHVPKSRKRELLSHLIHDGGWEQVLVFTKTKHGANRLAKQLETDGIRAAAIHGNKSQTARTRALADFKASKVRALVATDIAARGLDIDALPYVVNYEIPFVAEDYVHRIGRTGRAGSTGQAVSLVMPEEQKLLKAIERLIQTSIPVADSKDFAKPNPKVAAQQAEAKRANEKATKVVDRPAMLRRAEKEGDLPEGRTRRSSGGGKRRYGQSKSGQSKAGAKSGQFKSAKSAKSGQSRQGRSRSASGSSRARSGRQA